MFRNFFIILSILTILISCGTKKEDLEKERLKRQYEIEENKQITLNYYRVGLRKFENRQYKKAVNAFSEALKYNDRHSESYYMRALSNLSLGKTVLSIKDFTRALTNKPDLTRAYHLRGICYFLIKDYKKAIMDFNIAIKNKTDKFSYRFRGKSFYALGKYKRALEDFNEFISRNPDYPDIYNDRGETYNKLKKYEESIEDFTTAISKNNKNFIYFLNRGNAYFQIGKYKECMDDFDEMIRLKPDYARLYGVRYVVHHSLNKLKRALKDTNMIIKYTGGKKGHHERANIYAAMGKIDKAIEDYSILIKRNKSFITYLNRALLYKLKEDYKKAGSDIQKSLRIKPEFPYTRLFDYLLKRYEGKKNPDLKLLKGSSRYDLWVNNIIRMFHHDITPRRLLLHAGNDISLKCEAYYYIAEYYRLNGDLKKAKEFYRKSAETKSYDTAEQSAAQYEYSRM